MEETTYPDYRGNATDAPTAESRTSLPGPNAGDLPRPQKRRKISTACEPCRARKIRCDGNRPICGPCRHRTHSQQSCLYTKDAPKDGTEPDISTRSLIDRIQSLEHVIASSHQRAHENGGEQLKHNTRHPTPPHAVRDEVPPSPPANRHRVYQQPKDPENSTTPYHVPSNSLAGVNPKSYARNIEPKRDRVPDDRGSIPSNFGNYQTELTTVDVENISSPVNAMGSTAYIGNQAVSPLNAANEFYGGSSAAHFMQQVKETIPGASQIPNNDVRSSPRPALSKGTPLGTLDSYGSVPPSGNLCLPQRDLADKLLENYWTKAYSLYPFVYKPSFTRAYEDLWKPSSELQRGAKDCDFGLGTPGVSDSRTIVFHCAINAIFALSCQLSGPDILQQDRETLSQTFFLRAKSLLHVDILDHGSVALVQTLLIIAQYLQSTSFPSRCWNSLGLACRIGQGLGLHVEDRGLQRDPREVELRRRVWYGCTVMDIVASTTLGRPMMIPCQVIIPLPSVTPVDESWLEADKSVSQFTFYIETIKLYLILGRILSTIYKPWSVQGVNSDPERKESSSHFQPTDSEAIMSLDEELSNFEDGITSYLHWERGGEMRDSLAERPQLVIRRQTNVLHARYLHIRLLLHRPTFLRFCRKVGSSQQTHQPQSDNSYSVSAEHHFQKQRNLRSKMDVQSSAACIGAAVDLVNLLHSSTTSVSDGAWWYTTFYLCTAAMVLMLAESCLKTHQYFDHREIHGAWILCCKTLRVLSERGHPVEHALNGLCNMYKKLVPEQSPTEPLTKPQSRLAELASIATEEQEAAYDGTVQDRGASSLDLGPFQERSESNSQGPGGPVETDPVAMQPLMDFMTQDMSLMPFGLMDESWWRLQYGDSTMNFGM